MTTEQTKPIETLLQSVKECNYGNGGGSLERSHPSDQSQFIEEMGLMFEQVGMPRMAGRIFAWLLISEPPLQSSSELVAVLKASKGSISTMTRLLIHIGLIERVALPGDRRDYFQIKPHAWTEMSRQQQVKIAAFRKLAEQGLGFLADASPEHRQRLQEMHDIHLFWEREWPLLNRRWDEQNPHQYVPSPPR